jgi:hypothetical protein
MREITGDSTTKHLRENVDYFYILYTTHNAVCVCEEGWNDKEQEWTWRPSTSHSDSFSGGPGFKYRPRKRIPQGSETFENGL